MWLPILLTAGGFGIKRMRERQRARHRVLHHARPLVTSACNLWAPARPLAAAIVVESGPAVKQLATGLGPLNLSDADQVRVFTMWMHLLDSEPAAQASMVFAKHLGEQLAGGCRLDSFGHDLDVLRSIRDLGIVAVAQLNNRNPLRLERP